MHHDDQGTRMHHQHTYASFPPIDFWINVLSGLHYLIPQAFVQQNVYEEADSTKRDDSFSIQDRMLRFVNLCVDGRQQGQDATARQYQ